MEDARVIRCTSAQVANIPSDVDRIVMTLGSGMSAAGVLHGLNERELDIPVLGVQIGKSPTKTLDKYGPAGWQGMMEVVVSEHDYKKAVHAEIDGVLLDPIYEAKCAEYLEPGDLFWIIGVRNMD